MWGRGRVHYCAPVYSSLYRAALTPKRNKQYTLYIIHTYNSGRKLQNMKIVLSCLTTKVVGKLNYICRSKKHIKKGEHDSNNSNIIEQDSNDCNLIEQDSNNSNIIEQDSNDCNLIEQDSNNSNIIEQDSNDCNLIEHDSNDCNLIVLIVTVNSMYNLG